MRIHQLLFFICFFFLPGAKIFAQEETIFKKGEQPGPLHLGPSCQFSVLGNCDGDTAYFINHTIRLMNQSWEIADTSGILFLSQDTNIKFLFPYPGTYSVTLRADNGHPDSLTKILSIGAITKADFQFQQCTQQFVNMSSCANSFYWDFGDGNFSTLPLPIHVYSDTGSYVVQLIASNGAISDTMIQSIYVYSKGFPNGSFTYFQSNDTVYFFGDSLASNFNWDFGDQTYSAVMNPSHAYMDTGDFLVFLAVSNYCGLYTNSATIHVLPPAGLPFFQKNRNPYLLIYPNPFSDRTLFQIANTGFMNSQISVTDIYGREVFTEVLTNTDSLIFLRNDLGNGIYLVRLIVGGVHVSTTKAIVAK